MNLLRNFCLSCRWGVALLTLLLWAAAPNLRAETTHGSSDEASHPAGHAEGGHGHANHLALFAGLTRLDHEGADHHTETLDEETFGLEYERRLHGGTGRLGLGLTAERVGGEVDATLAFALLYLHFGEHFKLWLGPGGERSHGHEEAGGRLGLGLDFRVGKMVVGPALSVDSFDGEESYVGGITLGFGF